MRNRLLVIAGTLFAIVSTSNSTAWAGWGCKAANQAGEFARAWAAATEKEARANALRNCAASGYKRCRIVMCSDNVDNQQQADVALPLSRTQEVKKCFGAPCNKGAH
jgi:hypothetical protein